MLSSGRVVFSRMDEVHFGKPADRSLAEVVAALGARRVLLMASGTLNRQTDEGEKIRRALGDRCIGTFDAMPAHSPRSAVIAATRQARDGKADLIVTLGGGSITDGAKAVQLCLSNDVASVEDMDRIRGTAEVRPPTVRQVSMPTTLSAGEFSAIAGVTNEATRVKEMYRHPLTIPQAVILDPEITRHTPMWLFLSTGIRAVDHCVEAVCSNESMAYADASALHGLSLLSRGLARVKADPGDIAARLDCQLGSWLSMAGLAAGVPMGASHGIGYVLGAVFDVPHGHTSCIMLPAVMHWNKVANADRQALVAAALGQPGKDAGEALGALIGGLDMPRRLSDVKIGPDKFERIAEQAMGTPWVPRNPRPIPGPAQIREILEIAA